MVGLTFTLLLFLFGCAPSNIGEGYLQTYVKRLGGALELTAPPSSVVKYQQPVTPMIKSWPRPTRKIGLLPFLSLSGCQLQTNLARRNSVLTRNAPASQLLLLDLEFLTLAPACIKQMKAKNNSELASAIETLHAERVEQLPKLIFNATLASEEWRDFWRPPQNLGDYPEKTGSEIVDQLLRLKLIVEQWVNGAWSENHSEFELVLSELRKGDGGELLAAAVVSSSYLQTANELLAQSAIEKPLCPLGTETTRSRIVNNVVQQFFGHKVQRWLVDVRRRRELLLVPTRELELILSSALPISYLQWQKQREESLSRLSSDSLAHVRWIQENLKTCSKTNS